MKNVVQKLVAAFEMICGLSGLLMIAGALLNQYPQPFEILRSLWFGVFPVLSFVAGILLLLKSKYGFRLTFIALLLQIPFIYISGYPILRVALAFNLYLTAVWNSKAGNNATVLGINLLAIAVLIAFLWSKNTNSDDVILSNSEIFDSGLQ